MKKILELLEANNVSLKDLNTFAEQSKKEKFALEILYDDGSRSFFVEPDKTPIMIIVEGLGVAVENVFVDSWSRAKEYCENYSAGDKKWSLPNKEQSKVLYAAQGKISEILRSFGKKSLLKTWYWSAEHDEKNAWAIYFNDGDLRADNKLYSSYVLPVCVL